MSRIYLDHNATTPLAPEVLEAMMPYLSEHYGNASSPYSSGREARQAVDRAREQMAEFLGADPAEVVWTSGGTEANTMAVRSALAVSTKRHIVTTGVEHHAISEVVDQCQREGYAVTRVPVDEEGRLEMGALKEAFREDTALVTIMWANNETGVLFPIEAIGACCRERGIFFHVDAVQAAGKLELNLSELPVDSAAFSAHKFHGPKGVGALYLRRRAPFLPLMPGGGQERGRRGGTENVAGIVGIGTAATRSRAMLRNDCMKEAAVLRDRLETRIRNDVEGMRVNGQGAERLANTSSLTFDGVDGETLLLRLDQDRIEVSTGSACATGAMEPSHVLQAMGRKRQEALNTIRVSLGVQTTGPEVETAASAIVDAVQRVRAYEAN
jgi:cysteine desulfurase